MKWDLGGSICRSLSKQKVKIWKISSYFFDVIYDQVKGRAIEWFWIPFRTCKQSIYICTWSKLISFIHFKASLTRIVFASPGLKRPYQGSSLAAMKHPFESLMTQPNPIFMPLMSSVASTLTFIHPVGGLVHFSWWSSLRIKWASLELAAVQLWRKAVASSTIIWWEMILWFHIGSALPHPSDWNSFLSIHERSHNSIKLHHPFCPSKV